MGDHPIGQHAGDVFDGEIVGEAFGYADDHEHAAYHGHALKRDAGEIAAQGKPALDEAFHDEGINHGDGAGFHHGAESAEEAHDHDHRHGEFPLGFPE